MNSFILKLEENINKAGFFVFSLIPVEWLMSVLFWVCYYRIIQDFIEFLYFKTITSKGMNHSAWFFITCSIALNALKDVVKRSVLYRKKSQRDKLGLGIDLDSQDSSDNKRVLHRWLAAQRVFSRVRDSQTSWAHTCKYDMSRHYEAVVFGKLWLRVDLSKSFWNRICGKSC